MQANGTPEGLSPTAIAPTAASCTVPNPEDTSSCALTFSGHCSLRFIPVQTSAEFNAEPKTYTPCFRRSHRADSILPPPRSCFTAIKKLMSTLFQGSSGPSGLAGLGPVLRPPAVSGNHAAPVPVLILLQQIPSEQSISHQLRKLTVRLVTGVTPGFNLRAHELPGGTSNLSRRYYHSTRYDPVLLTKYPPSVTKEQIDALLKWLDKWAQGWAMGTRPASCR